MNNAKGMLLVVLLVQLALAAWLFFGDASGTESAKGLTSFEPASVNAIQITDAKSNTLRLSLAETGWQAADSRADEAKVAGMLEKLNNLESAWPVATSSAAQTRFEVADDNFQRRLQLYEDDRLVADLLFGTSPGFRRVHARAAASDDIYSVDFANHDLPIGEDDWLDRGLLALAAPVVGIQRLEHWSLVRSGEPQARWELNGEEANQQAAATLAGRFTSLQVLGRIVFEGELKGSFVLTAGPDRTSARYALYHNDEFDKYYITRDEQPARYEVASYIAEQMLVDANDLAPQPEAAEQAQDNPDLAEQLVEQTLDQTLEQAMPGVTGAQTK